MPSEGDTKPTPRSRDQCNSGRKGQEGRQHIYVTEVNEQLLLSR